MAVGVGAGTHRRAGEFRLGCGPRVGGGAVRPGVELDVHQVVVVVGDGSYGAAVGDGGGVAVGAVEVVGLHVLGMGVSRHLVGSAVVAVMAAGAGCVEGTAPGGDDVGRRGGGGSTLAVAVSVGAIPHGRPRE